MVGDEFGGILLVLKHIVIKYRLKYVVDNYNSTKFKIQLETNLPSAK